MAIIVLKMNATCIDIVLQQRGQKKQMKDDIKTHGEVQMTGRMDLLPLT